MPSRPINQQATSGPASELQSVVCTAEQVESCQQPFIHESNATGGQKRKQQRTVTNLFHPGYHLFEKPSSGRQNPVLKDQDHLPSQNNLAKSCHLTDTQPSKDSPSTTHMILPVGLVIVTAYYAPQIIITFVNGLASLTVVPTIHLQVIWSLNVRGPWCKV